MAFIKPNDYYPKKPTPPRCENIQAMNTWYEGWVLENGLDRVIAGLDHQFSKDGNKAPVEAFIADYGWSVWTAGKRLNLRRWGRKKRLAKRIRDAVLWDDALFVTLNFKPSTLDGTSPETRRRYVTRYLKSYCRFYVANIDYGTLNGREHYHAVVVPWKKMDFKPWHQYGGIKVEHIRSTEKDVAKVAKYCSKVTNHAFKASAGKMPKMIYSRDLF